MLPEGKLWQRKDLQKKRDLQREELPTAKRRKRNNCEYEMSGIPLILRIGNRYERNKDTFFCKNQSVH